MMLEMVKFTSYLPKKKFHDCAVSTTALFSNQTVSGKIQGLSTRRVRGHFMVLIQTSIPPI